MPEPNRRERDRATTPRPGLVATMRAFGWLRWRMLVNRLRSARRRDLLGRLSRWADLIGLVVMVLALLPLLPTVTFGALAVGWAIGSERIAVLTDAGPATILRGVLFFFSFLALVLPFTLTVQRAQPATERLVLLPIDRRRLHLARYLSCLLDPVLLGGGVALGCFALGLAGGGRPLVGGIALVAGLLLLATLAAMIVTIEAVLPRLLRRRGRRDAIVLALSFLVLVASLSVMSFDEESAEAVLGETILLVNVPGELYTQTLFAALGEQFARCAFALAGLAGAALLAYRVFVLAHERVLTPEGGRRSWKGRGKPSKDRGRHRFTPAGPIWAIASVELRWLSRTVTGKMALVQGALGAGMVAIVAARSDLLAGEVAARVGPELVMLGAALVLTCLGLMPILFNQYAIDRAGLTLGFLLPLSAAQHVRGRLLAHAGLAAGSIALAWLTTAALARLPFERLVWSALFAALGTVSVVAPLGALGALTSVVLPRSVDLGRAFQQNQPHSLAALLGMAATAFACGVPALLAVAGQLLLESPLLTALLLGGWLVLGIAVAAAVTALAARLLEARRESLLLVAAETKSR